MSANVLDQPDRPFPGPMGFTIPGLQKLYRQAKRLAWDLDSAVEWDRFDSSPYSGEVLAAARLYWSGRAWSEYNAIAESPALQLRYDLDQLEPDLSLFWALRTEEEARHSEVSARMAELLGGYLSEPTPSVAPEQGSSASPHLGTRDRALSTAIPVEATIAGLVCVAEVIVYDVFLELLRQLSDPVAKQIFRLIVRDEVRHCEFGWVYLAHRSPSMNGDQKQACADAMAVMIQEVELGGYRSSWLAPTRNPEMVAVDRLVFAAGLGGTTAEWEGPIIIGSIRRLRDRAAALDIHLPSFHHPALGVI